MSRNQKLAKLRNAIVEYRGSYNAKTKVWTHPPKPAKLRDIQRWLTALGVTDHGAALIRIDAFETQEVMGQWLSELSPSGQTVPQMG